jgi:8-oxo-dGTP pyrophosphatase MutT (NUDIX family)
LHSDLVAATKLVLMRARKALATIPFPREASSPLKRRQVAAVCYRVRRLKVEFLLVRTRKGRWTFPKGGVMAGLTYAQSAALEAFEEAGVHGRIEEAAFARYTLRRRGSASHGSTSEDAIQAHLCEVLGLEDPQEPGRDPTWFSPEKARLCLCDRRTSDDARELSRLVDRAVVRIGRLSGQSGHLHTDPMRRVHFEGAESKNQPWIARTAFVAYARGDQRKPARAPVLEFDAYSRKFIRIGSTPRRDPR